MIKRFLSNYVARHQNRANQLLHVVGLPVTFGLPVYFLVDESPDFAGLAFVGGYVLQFIGHALEGNDAGEVVLVKKLLGRPYQEFAPEAKQSKSDD